MSSGLLPPDDMYPAGEQNVTARFISLASGLSVRVVESGSANSPPVVLVPGWACTAWVFHETLPALAGAGFRAIAVELKGHGLSDKPPDEAEYTVESMRDHLVDILNALSLPVTGLVGHSMGASVAAHAAAVIPDRVSGLALVAPVGFAGVRGLSLFRLLTPASIIPWLPAMASRLVVKTMLEIVYGDLRDPGQRDVDEFRAPAQFPGFTRSLRHLLHAFDWKRPFPKLALPHFVIAGTRDHLSLAKDAQRYSDRPALVIEGAGHVLFSEAPDLVNTALISFFRSPAGRGYISPE
jgi:pimeloyl-ACP methyl ester carboxylesterase